MVLNRKLNQQEFLNLIGATNMQEIQIFIIQEVILVMRLRRIALNQIQCYFDLS
jgi:hypothetical protein